MTKCHSDMPRSPDTDTLEAIAAYYREDCPVRAAMAAVSEISKVPISAMLGPSKVQEIAHARQYAYLVARKSGCTTKRIGRVMDRCHTTVSTGSREAEKRLSRRANA